ncbi:MAG: hypothetical protein OQK77_02195 [Psychromonas sp.]|nr:hypothetical protein [Psychromonas sp.]
MFKKKWLPQNGIFSIPLVREIALILVIKVIVIFTIQHFYFSDPVPFNADHLFGKVSSSTATNIIQAKN